MKWVQWQHPGRRCSRVHYTNDFFDLQTLCGLDYTKLRLDGEDFRHTIRIGSTLCQRCASRVYTVTA